MKLVSAGSEARYCRNCHYPMPQGASFCSECGQKYTTGKQTLWELCKTMLSSVLNVDSRLWLTLRHLLVPGKLTLEFFKGRHRQYMHPVRIFLLMAVAHFAVLSLILVEVRDKTIEAQETRKLNLYRHVFWMELDSAQAQVQALFPQPVVAQALDSLRGSLGVHEVRDSTRLFYYNPLTKKFENRNIDSHDVLMLPAAALMDKYGFKDPVVRFQVSQLLRIILKEGSNFLSFILGNLVWMVILMMPALALLLKLLYIRRRKYFVEHLVFSFHYHAFSFLAFTLAILLTPGLFRLSVEGSDLESGSSSDIWISLAFIAVMVYLFAALWRVYQQGYVKTFIKFCVINFSYIFIFLVSLALTLVIGALLF